MVSSPGLSLDSASKGFLLSIGYYGASLFSCIVLAFLMPLADMCNPGPPLLTGARLLGLGLLWAAAVLMLFLLGSRSGLVQGSLTAHLVVASLVGIGGLLII